MEKILLSDLPKRKDLIGKRLNVVRQGGEYHYDYQDVPMIRIFAGAKVKKEKGVKWLYWYWAPEPLENRLDCGYSGVTLKTNYGNSYLMI